MGAHRHVSAAVDFRFPRGHRGVTTRLEVKENQNEIGMAPIVSELGCSVSPLEVMVRAIDFANGCLVRANVVRGIFDCDLYLRRRLASK